MPRTPLLPRSPTRPSPACCRKPDRPPARTARRRCSPISIVRPARAANDTPAPGPGNGRPRRRFPIPTGTAAAPGSYSGHTASEPSHLPRRAMIPPRTFFALAAAASLLWIRSRPGARRRAPPRAVPGRSARRHHRRATRRPGERARVGNRARIGDRTRAARAARSPMAVPPLPGASSRGRSASASPLDPGELVRQAALEQLAAQTLVARQRRRGRRRRRPPNTPTNGC